MERTGSDPEGLEEVVELVEVVVGSEFDWEVPVCEVLVPLVTDVVEVPLELLDELP